MWDLPEPGRPRRMTTSLRALLLRPGCRKSLAALSELSGGAGCGGCACGAEQGVGTAALPWGLV